MPGPAHPVALFGRAAAMMAALLLAACAPRPELIASTGGAVATEGAFPVLAVTTRARASSDTNVFTRARSPVPHYALFEMAAMPGRQPGAVGPTAFQVQRQAIVTSRAALLDRIARGTGVGLFVHGYNHTFPEALSRTAQLSADGVLGGAPVLFAWPSEARVQGYLYDRDSAAASRDALAGLLADLAGRGPVEVVAHSMGAWLTVEAMRQLRLEGRGAVLDRLSVVLAAPDIDTDVFAAQMAVIGPMRQPMKILVAPDDRALILSGRLSGETQRLGALDVSDPRIAPVARAYNIAVIDISQLRAGDGLRHDRYAGLGSVTGPRNEVNDLRRAGTYVMTALGGIVSAPFDAIGGALSPD